MKSNSIGGFNSGYATKGCLPEAQQKIYGNLDQLFQLQQEPDRVRNDILKRTAADERYQRLMKSWSECMVKKGFQFGSPNDAEVAASNEYSKSGYTSATRQKEIDIAVADGECAAQVNLDQETKSIQTEYARKISRDDERLILQLFEFRRQAMERAKSISLSEKTAPAQR